MLKNKFKITLILALLLIFLLIPFAHAVTENDARIGDDAISIQEDNQLEEDEFIEEADKNAKNTDVYLFGDDITIDYTVIGNAFIVGNNVKISAPIGGDAFIIAKNITIEESGYIYSNLFSCSEKLVIKGIVYDLYATASNITLAESGYVYRDIRSTSSNIDILGTIGRNAYIACDKISLTSNQKTTDYNSDSTESSTGVIYGNLEYSSTNQITIPENSVTGEVRYTQISSNSNNSITIIDIIVSIISTIVFTAVIWLILNWLAPKYIEKSKKLLTSKPLPVIGFGFLGLIVIPVITFILLLLSITIELSLLLLGIYIILIALSTTIFTISISEFISEKLNINKKWLHLIVAIVVASIIYLIKLIPYIGGIVGFVCVILGLGLLVKGILPNKEKEQII